MLTSDLHMHTNSWHRESCSFCPLWWLFSLVDESYLSGADDLLSPGHTSCSSGRNLWVSGLSSSTRAADLKSLFSKHGKVGCPTSGHQL